MIGMKVSVIVPVYNAEEYLICCIESIIRQTYRNIEIILIDDGSCDRSGEICDEYARKDCRIRVVHKDNEGVSKARNTGLKIAEGTHVLFVDADDNVAETHIETLVTVLETHHADFAVSTYCRAIENVDFSNTDMGTGDIKILDPKSAILDMLLVKGFDCSVCCKLCPAEIAREIQFREGLSIAEDMAFHLFCMKRVGRIVFVDKKEYCYVQRGGSANHSFSEKKASDLLFFEELINAECDLDIREALYSKYISTCFHMLSFSGNASNRESREKLKRVVRKNRSALIRGKNVSMKVRMACLFSYAGFWLVNVLLSIKR